MRHVFVISLTRYCADEVKEAAVVPEVSASEDLAFDSMKKKKKKKVLLDDLELPETAGSRWWWC